jgi:hypothetical protein
VLISFAKVDNNGSILVVAIVPSEYTLRTAGPALIAKIEAHLPALPVMLVSIENNGPRAFAFFETHMLLALLQLEKLHLSVLDLRLAPPEAELPF